MYDKHALTRGETAMKLECVLYMCGSGCDGQLADSSTCSRAPLLTPCVRTVHYIQQLRGKQPIQIVDIN